MPERSRIDEGQARARPRHLVDGDGISWWRMLDPRRLRFAVGASLLAMPVLVLDNLPTRSNSAEAVETAAEADDTTTTAAPITTSTTVRVTTTLPPTTTTTPPPSTTVTTAPPRTTTTAARRVTAPPTAVQPTDVPSVAPVIQPVAPAATDPAAPAGPAEPASPPAPPPPPAANTESGKATWYHWNPGECAHKTIPKGTVVTVTRVSTGATTTCTVTDRGPYGAGRIIDLDSTVFDDLAGLGAGVIDVVITW